MARFSATQELAAKSLESEAQIKKLVTTVGFLRYIGCCREIVAESRSKGEKVKISKIAILVGILLCLGSLSLMAQSVRIGGESLRINGQVIPGHEYTGPCPVDLKFGWGLIATGPTTVNYHFVRSDGGHSAHGEAVYIPQANHSVPVYDEWHLGANNPRFANFVGSVQLVIDSPNPVQGNIKFTLHCQ